MGSFFLRTPVPAQAQTKGMVLTQGMTHGAIHKQSSVFDVVLSFGEKRKGLAGLKRRGC